MNLNFPIAFAAGFFSFFAPCFIPLVPAYIAYVTGVSLEDLKTKGYAHYIKRLLITSFFYILGFSLIFTLLGTAAAGIGVTLRSYGTIIERVGGVMIFLLGLEFAGLLNLPFLAKEFRLNLPQWTNRLGNFRSFFIGIVFALAWTPCIGAVLGSILTLAAVSETVLSGAMLLFVYSLGIALPFLIASLTLATLPRYLKSFRRVINLLTKFAGILLAALGLLLLTGTYKYLSSWLVAIALKLGYTIRY